MVNIESIILIDFHSHIFCLFMQVSIVELETRARELYSDIWIQMNESIIINNKLKLFFFNSIFFI